MKLEVGKKYELNNGMIVTMQDRENNGGATFYADGVGLYFSDGTFGYGDICRSYPYNVKRCLYANTLTVGNTYTSINGIKYECIFVREGKAWMTSRNATAYTWDANTGKAICLPSEYDISFPERRKGSVEYVYGVPVFDTWHEEE